VPPLCSKGRQHRIIDGDLDGRHGIDEAPGRR
jgi:hypothetical protein